MIIIIIVLIRVVEFKIIKINRNKNRNKNINLEINQEINK